MTPTLFPAQANRMLRLAAVLLTALLIASCATSALHSSGRLARVTPKSFIGINAQHILIGVDIDSRVPASLNRGPDFRVAVFPVDHNAWEPIGGRLKMRPLNLLGKAPDAGAGKAMKAWLQSPPGGRVRVAYVLTNDAKAELAQIQSKFSELLKKYPPGGNKKGVLRLGADPRFLINEPKAAGNSVLQTWLQLQVAEGPFVLWKGRIQDMR